MKWLDNDGGKEMIHVITNIERPSQDLIDNFACLER